MKPANPQRSIRNVFLVRGDADDLVANLKGLHPRTYVRTCSAEGYDLFLYVVVADKDDSR